MHRYLRLLRRRDYALLWTGATISALGDGMSFMALLWLVLEREGSPTVVGWLAAAYAAPVVIGGLAAGILLDRVDRRRMLVADNLVRGLAIASIPVAGALGALTTTHVFVVALVYGLLFMTSLAGIPSILPALVDDDELTTANAMESISYGIAGVAGPAVAGALIVFVGATTVLVLDAATYAVFVACLLGMRLPSDRPLAVEPATPDPETMAGTTTTVSAATVAGIPAAPAGSGLGPAIRFLLGTPAILAITLIYMAINIGEGIFPVLAPLYARDVLGGDARTYGILVSSFTAGTLVGAAVVGGIDWRWPLGRSIAAAVLATGLTLALLLALPPLLPAVAILALAGALASSLTAWAQTIRMRLIPAAMRGRVFALLRTLMQSTPPIGAVIGGALLAGGDPVPAIAAMAAFVAIPGAIGLVLPALGPEATGEARQRGGATPT